MSALAQTLIENPSVETPGKTVWTDEEFMALDRDGHRYEIVNGDLMDRGNSGAKHGYVAVILSSALFAVVLSKTLGAVFDSSTAFKMKNGNRRSPDYFFLCERAVAGIGRTPYELPGRCARSGC